MGEDVDRFKKMTELLAHLSPDNHYRIQYTDTRDSKVKLFAPHGGCIEPCTGSLVMEIAGESYDYFVFHGMMMKNCFQTLHVSSTRYDEPHCQQMARQALVAVAIHGCDGDKEFVEIGGGNSELVANLHDYLTGHGYPAICAPKNRKGEDERNFINLAREKGVQLELSSGFRKSLFPDFPRTGQKNPRTTQPFISTMQGWLKSLEGTIV